jgi:hypothetical protein
MHNGDTNFTWKTLAGKNHGHRPAIITIEELNTNAGDTLGCRTLPCGLRGIYIYRRNIRVLLGKNLRVILGN